MTNSNQKERFQTKIAMLEQNHQVLQNKCEEYLGELIRTRKALETIRLHLMTAKGRFNLYDEYLVSGMDSPDARFIKEEIENALEQITALEQKDK